MRNFIDWIDDSGFWMRDTWDSEKKKMKGSGKMKLEPHQRRIFSHILTFNENGDLPYETILYSATKKSGKTTLAAAVGAWYAEEARAGTEIYVIANSKEHAEGRVFRDIMFHFKKRVEEGVYSDRQKDNNYINITQFRIEFKNGTFIQVLGQSFKASAGSRHALTLWDELWGTVSEQDRRMWDEMTPIPTVENSIRFISTYAGFENESELLWELYTSGVGSEEHDKGQGQKIEALEDLPCWANGRMFTYWTHDPTMPWQTDEYLESQMKTERPAAFLRLHRNMWVTSHEEFIPVSMWDRAATAYEAPATIWGKHPFKDWPIVIGVDAGIKRDSTALVGVGYDSARGKVGIAFHKIWTPSKLEQVDLDMTVEKELLELYNKFKIVSVIYDPTHLMQTMLRLSQKGIPTRQYQQTPANMIAASQLLYDLLKGDRLEAYPDEELRRNVQMAVAESTARGFRIVKTKVIASNNRIDAAIALAMACYGAVESGGVDTTIPLIIRSPFAELSKLQSQADRDIPFPLRS